MTTRDDDLHRLQAELDAARARLVDFEEASQRLTRLYAARSRCSEAILRCHGEAELFPAVCRAAVDFGGMAMAWIGIVDQATQQVMSVASFGDEHGYLKGIRISVDVTESFARGPTGLAIRTNEPVWCADFHSEPGTTPWHERATRAGWRSSASVPLRRDGLAIGALNLYAITLNAFDENTQTLVQEMAADISFALDGFAREAARGCIEAENYALAEQNRKLQKSESLGRMAGAIAHHFNNQLHALMLNLEIAMDGLPHDSDRFEILTDAWQSAHKAAEVSVQMLAYLGQSQSKRELLDVSESCQAKLPALQSCVPEGVPLETHLPTPGPTIYASANDLQRVLMNLLSNAGDASAETQTVVRLNVKTVAASDISPVNRVPVDWQASDERYACLEVADTGSGISADDVENLFDPFFSTKFVGRGLGLPVVLGIVRAHEGVITVESRRGKGSVFRVYLPLRDEALCTIARSE